MNHRSASTRSSYAMAALLLVAITIILGGCTTVVQPIEHYTTADGYISVTFPAEWDVVEDYPARGRTMVYLATNNGVVYKSNVMSENGLYIEILPTFVVDLEGPLKEFPAIQLIDRAYYDMMADETIQLGYMETFAFDDGTFVDRFSISAEEANGMFYAYQLDDNLMVQAIAVTSPDMDVDPVVEQILSTVTFSGDEERYLDSAKTMYGVE